jgi:hypothetical protein
MSIGSLEFGTILAKAFNPAKRARAMVEIVA